MASAMTSKRRTLSNPSKAQTRPEPRNALERAKRIADDLEGMREDHERDLRLRDRFRDAGEGDVVRMWETRENEDSKPLSRFEWEALHVRWFELFKFLPPDDQAEPAIASDPAHDPDLRAINGDLLTIEEVARLTTLSHSTINRMYREQPPRLPPPVPIGERRKAWRRRDIEAWVDARDEQTNRPANRRRHG
jgi:predicted DNA-binding transcriptional regulator AlpA